MRNLKIAMFIFMISFQAMATLFQPISVKKHLIESSGVIEGEIVSIESELGENDKIVTRVILRPDKWIGNLEMPETDEVSILYPGGQVGNQVRKIEGVPDFALGESVVVFIRNHDGEKWVSNLGLGKYSIKRMGNEKIIVNQIFPTEPNMGQMSLKNFYQIAQEVKEQKFSYRFKEKYELYNEQDMIDTVKNQKDGRAIASVDEHEESASKFNPFWLVFFLGFLGLFVAIIKKRES